MNYGIGPGGGFGVSVPLGGYTYGQSYSPYQTQGWNGMQGSGNWSQHAIGHSQPGYNQQSAGWKNIELGYGQPVNHGWTSIQPTGWSGQPYSTPQAFYSPPQQYGYPPMPLMPGCGNCGHTKPVIRRDW